MSRVATNSVNLGAATVLKQSTYFAGLDEALINQIANLSVNRSFRAGEVIFHRDEPGDYLYGVMSGQVRLTTQSSDGRELALNSQGPGEISGEIAFLDGGNRTATGTA